MHTVWKGAISFGLVHVPVKMFTATENRDISMRYIHQKCGTPVSYVKKCHTCEAEVEWEEIIKGYEYEKGKFVLFEKEELDALNGETNKEIEILDFVDLTEIDPVYFQKTYYLSPGETGANAYSLLREAMLNTGKIGIAKVTIRSKSSLAALRVIDRCIAMETIYYPDEIRSISAIPQLPENTQVKEQELKMAEMLIGQLSTAFEPQKYTDDYRERVLSAIEKKVAGEEIQTVPQKQDDNILDLMSALQASLDSVKTDAQPKSKSKTKTKKKDSKATVS